MAQHDLLSRATECSNETVTMQQVIVVTDTVHSERQRTLTAAQAGSIDLEMSSNMFVKHHASNFRVSRCPARD